MSSRRLPPLNALRAFEATARHLSVKQAAEELFVTPGAVSQLLKTLEQDLGVQLFRRVNRGILLTDAGQAYLPPIRSAFRQITEATAQITAASGSGRLTVSVPPFFAAVWLIPRLRSFQEAHPGVDLQITASKVLTSFTRDDVDIAIRHGLGRYPGLRSIRLLALELIPVATPALVSRLGAPTAPEDLARWPLVHDAERRDWPLWFQAQAVSVPDPLPGSAFDDITLMLKAVLADQGAGLVPAALVTSELERGELVRLTDVSWPQPFAYYLVYPEAHHDQPKVSAFREWILGAAANRTGALDSSRGMSY